MKRSPQLDFDFQDRAVFFEQDQICGVDEAGRGCWAGDVFAAAVILPTHWREIAELNGLTDSKKLSAKKREQLDVAIRQFALAYAVASATVEEIDQINILQASLLAMRRCLDELALHTKDESQNISHIIVDGVHCPESPSAWLDVPMCALIEGDSKVAAISAASVLAKVARDRSCNELHRQYPDYGFNQHKGYGTALHAARLKQLGATPAHRKSFKPVRLVMEASVEK